MKHEGQGYYINLSNSFNMYIYLCNRMKLSISIPWMVPRRKGTYHPPPHPPPPQPPPPQPPPPPPPPSPPNPHAAAPPTAVEQTIAPPQAPPHEAHKIDGYSHAPLESTYAPLIVFDSPVEFGLSAVARLVSSLKTTLVASNSTSLLAMI